MAFSSAWQHLQFSSCCPDFSRPSLTARQRSHPPSSQCLVPAGVPLYPVETICLPLTRTAPFAEERQVERDFTTFATCMKYSSHDGRLALRFSKVLGNGGHARRVIRKAFGGPTHLYLRENRRTGRSPSEHSSQPQVEAPRQGEPEDPSPRAPALHRLLPGLREGRRGQEGLRGRHGGGPGGSEDRIHLQQADVHGD